MAVQSRPASLVVLVPGGALILAGVALIIWTLRHNRSGNWQVAPAVRAGARLITDGPYRRVRHPMYVAVLGSLLGFVVLDHHAIHLVAWGLLAALFAVKARIEERVLVTIFADYPAYQRRTGGFWPRLG